jgi:hypothetical protein
VRGRARLPVVTATTAIATAGGAPPGSPPARNRPAGQTSPDTPYAAFRNPEQSVRRVEWVRCVVCGTVVMDQADVYKTHFRRRRLALAG